MRLKHEYKRRWGDFAKLEAQKVGRFGLDTPPSFIFMLKPHKDEYGISYGVRFSVLKYKKCKFHKEN